MKLSAINLPKVRDWVRKYYACDTLDGAMLENIDVTGMASSHWEKLFLYNDIMTVSSPMGLELVSNLNVALLDDTNWYV